MPLENDDDDPQTVSPDDVFALLGNQTRSKIVQTLGETDESLSFSELRNAVGVRDSGQFNYHLDKLVGHFVRQTDDGYALRQTGNRVVEAVLSGVVTESPVVAPTPVDGECHYCGGSVVMSYRQEQVDVFCTECTGAYGERHATGEIAIPEGYGWLGGLPLPPAGVQNRTASEVLDAATTLGQTEFVAASEGVCPRCSATVTKSVNHCSEHDPGDGICPECDRRRDIVFSATCTNCNYETGGGLIMALLANTDFLDFMTDHGFNPIAPDSLQSLYGTIADYETEIRSEEPFEVDVTLSIDGDTYSTTVTAELETTE